MGRAVVDALERVTNLVALLLSARQPLSLERIGDELAGQYPTGEGAMRGAFERDKALLREIGVPIESEVLTGSDAGRTGYWIDRVKYELSDLELEPDERAALQMAVAAARLADAEFGLLKLGGEGESTPVVVANIPELAALPELREAASGRAEVVLRYHDRERTVQPYTLLLREGFWYLIGLDLGHHQVRTFRVDRIEGAVKVGTPGAFARPIDFDPRAVFPTDPKLLGDEVEARAEVLVDVPRADAVVRELGDEAVLRRVGDAVVVSVPCANRDAFRSWLFGLGTHAEVLAPQTLRADVVAWLEAMVAR